MALRTADLLGVGVGGGDLASLISGGLQSGVAAAGTSLATATKVTGDVVVVGSGTGGVRLRSASLFPSSQVIINQSGTTISVYPPSSTGVIATSSAAAAYSLGGASHLVEFVAYQPEKFAVKVSKTSI